jgi:succinate dehydrogenase (ubiquinone) cytochrome b560 subunit
MSRTIQTESIPASNAAEILNKQRILRPSSPHLTIYQPQLTWVASMFHRVTGGALSVRTFFIYPIFSSELFTGDF